MGNIEYLELFFRKHGLSGKLTVHYSSPVRVDEFLDYVTLEDGETIYMSDIIFDIESGLPEDMLDMWLEARKENGLSFPEWLQTDTHYVPKNMDKSSVEEYQREMEGLFDQVKNSIDTILKFQPDDSDDEGGEE